MPQGTDAPTVAVTGAGGLIGRALVDALTADARIGRVVAVDREPLHHLPPRVPWRVADVRDRAALAAALADVDAVVHLAFQLDPLHDERAMWEVNVDGTRNVAEVAAEQGVAHLVVASSATAYGAHPDNPVPLTEEHPLRAEPAFPYAHHKAEVERWLARWVGASEAARPRLTVLRPAMVAGPGVDNFISAQLDAPRFPVVRGHAPPFQFVHVDDVVDAFVHVVACRLAGTYNVASEGWLSLGEVTAILGRSRLEVPEEIAYGVADLLWRARVSPSPAGQLPYVMHPWILDVSSLVATGWRPRHSNRDALAALAAEHADRLALGPLRTSRSAVRRGLAIAAGTLAVWLVGRARRGLRSTAGDDVDASSTAG